MQALLFVQNQRDFETHSLHRGPSSKILSRTPNFYSISIRRVKASSRFLGCERRLGTSLGHCQGLPRAEPWIFWVPSVLRCVFYKIVWKNIYVYSFEYLIRGAFPTRWSYWISNSWVSPPLLSRGDFGSKLIKLPGTLLSLWCWRIFQGHNYPLSKTFNLCAAPYRKTGYFDLIYFNREKPRVQFLFYVTEF